MAEHSGAAKSAKKNYLSRSWALLTSEKGWYKPILVFAAVFCIPVAGPILGTLGLIGYSLEWARLTAWGIDAVPKQRNVNIGGCLGSGWRGFWVRTCWGLLFGLALGLLQLLLSMLFLMPLAFVLGLLSVIIGAVGLAASLRAAIYEKFGAGFGFSQLWQMIRRDTDGFFTIVGVQLLGGIIIGVVGMVVAMLTLGRIIPSLMPYVTILQQGNATGMDALNIVDSIMQVFLGMSPVLAVVGFVVRLVSVVFELLSCTVAGLWMRQFDVASWGAPSDPLPAEEA